MGKAIDALIEELDAKARSWHDRSLPLVAEALELHLPLIIDEAISEAIARYKDEKLGISALKSQQRDD